MPYEQDREVLALDVSLKNVGKTKVIAGPRGMRLTVVKLPSGLKAETAVMRDGIKIAGSTPVIEDFDMLKHYPGDPYEIEPGAEYFESEALIIHSCDILAYAIQFYAANSPDDPLTQYGFTQVGSPSVCAERASSSSGQAKGLPMELHGQVQH
jgi:hypothetical protein